MADLLARVAPVLGFLVSITVVAELSDRAGVFGAAAHAAARAARGRVWVLWLLVVVLASVSTIVLSLDTTAVLLTPVVLATARRLDLPATGLALATVWLANTASLLLPVSNLTNLLSWHRMQALDVGVAGFVHLTWAPALAAVVVTVVALVALFGRQLRGRFLAPEPPAHHDRVLLATASVVCLLLVPAFLTGNGQWQQPWRGYNGARTPSDVQLKPGELSEGQAWQRLALGGRLAASGAQAGIAVFLRGQLWDLGSSGPGLVVDRGGQRLAEDGPGARLINLWL